MPLPTAFNEAELMAEMDPGNGVGPFDNPYDNQVLRREVRVTPDQPTNEIGYDPPEHEIGPQDFAGEMVIPTTDDVGVDGYDTEDPGEPEDEWPEYLLREAGLTAEQAAEHFADSRALADVVRMQDQSYIQRGQLAAIQQPVETAPVEEIEEYPDFEMPQLEDGEWDENVTRAFTQMNNNFKRILQNRDAKLRGIEEQYRQQREFDEQRARQQTVAQFDRFIDDLGPQFSGLFGNGNSADLSQQSMAFRNRARVMQTANALQSGIQADGRMPLPYDEAYTRAIMAIFPAEVINHVRQSVATEAQTTTANRQRLMTARPTARRQPSKPITQEEREQRAMQTAEKFYRDRGFPALAGDYDNSLNVI